MAARAVKLGVNGKDKGQGTDTAKEHKEDQNILRERAQLICNADRKAYCRNSRNRFKTRIEDGKIIQGGNEDGAEDDQEEIHHEEHRCLVQCILGNTPAKAGNIGAAPHHGPHRCQEGKGRRRLNAAGRRARRPADEHEQDQDSPVGFGKGHEIDAVKAGCTRRHGLEHGREEVRRIVVLAKFRSVKDERRHDDEHSRHDQDDLGLQAVRPDVEAVGTHIGPGHKAQAADDDEQHDDRVDDRVEFIRRKGAAASRSHNIKAGITKGRNGVEHSIPPAGDPAVLRRKDRIQKQCAYELNDGDILQDEEHQLDDALELWRRQCFLHGIALHEADLTA